MNRLRDIVLIGLVLLQVGWLVLFCRRQTKIVEQRALDIGRPDGVFTVNFGEDPGRFKVGQFYVLKVLRVKGTQVDYGFCGIDRGENDSN